MNNITQLCLCVSSETPYFQLKTLTNVLFLSWGKFHATPLTIILAQILRSKENELQIRS